MLSTSRLIERGWRNRPPAGILLRMWVDSYRVVNSLRSRLPYPLRKHALDNQLNRLANKVALVTGGASGLGKGIAQRFVEEGATTCITDVSEQGQAVAELLGASYL